MSVRVATRPSPGRRSTRVDRAMTRHRVSLPAGALLAVLLACSPDRSAPAPGGAGGERSHLTLGIISVTATYLPLYLAEDDGVFAKEGLQVELLPFRGGSDLIKALVSGSVDVGVVSLAEVLSGIDAGQPLRAFYGGFNVPAFDWYAIPTIQTIAQAKGRRFGVTQYGSSTDFLARYALATHGLDPARDVQIVQGGDSPTRLAAMRAGQIDVNIFAPPDTFVAADQGHTRLPPQKDPAPAPPHHVFVAKDSLIAERPDTLKALLRAFVLGLRSAKADKAHAIETLLKRIPMDPKYAGPTYDDLINYLFEDGRLPTEEGLKAFFDMGIKGGRFKEAWARERYWTPAFVESFERWKPAE